MKEIGGLPERDAARRDAEHQAPAVGRGHHADRPGLPEEHAVARRRRGRRLGDGAPVAAHHEADALLAEEVDGRRGGRRAGTSTGTSRIGVPSTPPAAFTMSAASLHAVELVQSARALRAAQRIDRADADRVPGRRGVPGARGQERRQASAAPSSVRSGLHRITASRLAAAWVAAGTDQRPVDQALPGEEQPRPEVDRERRPTVGGDVDQCEQRPPTRRRPARHRGARAGGTRRRGRAPPRRRRPARSAPPRPRSSSVAGAGATSDRASATAASPITRQSHRGTRAGAFVRRRRGRPPEDTSAPAARIRT